MNDRFKFRVYHKPTNKIYNVYGFNDDFVFIDTLDTCEPLKTEDCILLQCTGLKDKNGKLIYEGDIVEDEYGEKYIVKFGKHTVTIPIGYDNGETECYGWHLNGNYWSCHLNPDDEYLIIGNIHENPDLLENK